MKPPGEAAFAVLFLLLVGACSGSGTPATSTRPAPTTSAPNGEVVVSPEFIQGAIPGAEVVLLVSQDDETAGTATVTASASGAKVSVRPSEISDIEVAEVTVVPDATATETELTVTIEVATDDTTRTVTRTASVLPWDDDRGEQAAEILGLFTSWLAGNRLELNITPETEFEGTFLAPQLLVVSHYGFFNDEWEIGLAWHVMIPPDDFAEIYLRPRSALRPTLAFRIGSWQTALDKGGYQIAEVEPPFEVVR
ncbi:MAG TPA: hypothetical protein VLA91_15065 [Acidimicrobiia bacterium]|nr:hypothetical protein [Acidimicrobiia bacterium]